jgi:spermidine/putrescine-binding protein
MLKAGMLEPLDHSKIPNMANIAKAFQDAAFDPGRKYSMPYMWGTLGVGYRKSKTGETDMADWKPLFDSDQFAGRISLLGDAQNVIGCTLKYLGHSFNSTDPAQIKQAEELLIAQKKNIKTFAKDNGQDMLASGEVDVCMEWNGDIKQVIAEDKDLAYAVPKQGSLLWQDCVCIPKGAPHPNNAHHQLPARRRGRQGHHRDHPVRLRQPGGEGADAGRVPRRSGDLPARGRSRQVRAGHLRRRGRDQGPRRGLDANSGGLTITG